jgi:hypothetical protein
MPDIHKIANNLSDHTKQARWSHIQNGGERSMQRRNGELTPLLFWLGLTKDRSTDYTIIVDFSSLETQQQFSLTVRTNEHPNSPHKTARCLIKILILPSLSHPSTCSCPYYLEQSCNLKGDKKNKYIISNHITKWMVQI